MKTLPRKSRPPPPKKRRHKPRPRKSRVDLGIEKWRVPLHSHIAWLWETRADFEEAVGFLAAGLRGSDHCVVVGDERETRRVLSVLEKRGLPVKRLQDAERLVVLRPEPSAQEFLDKISRAFERARAAGAPGIRLLGNVGWRRKTWPTDAELFFHEARLNDIARRVPCVLLCLHEVRALTGPVAIHGVLATHPHILTQHGVLASPFFAPLEKLRERLGAISGELSKQQSGREALARETEMLQVILATIPTMVSFRDSSGRLIFVNREWERSLGWTLEEAQRVDLLARSYPDAEERRRVLEWMQDGEQRWADFRATTRQGTEIDASWIGFTLRDGTHLRFGQDTSQRRRAEEALRALSERLQAVREEERARIAREVHDEVGQALTALQMDTAWLLKKLGSVPGKSAELSAKLESMAGLIATTHDSVQRIATELRPGVLDELGLEAAVEWWVREFEQRTAIACRIHSDLRDARIDPDRSTAVFRILQEALTNVARHAGATQVDIHLSADPGQLRLEVQDNGRGISGERSVDARSLGLLGMRERARSFGGDVTFRGEPGPGTTVTLTLPR